MLLQRIVTYCTIVTDKELEVHPRSGMRALMKIAPDLKPGVVA